MNENPQNTEIEKESLGMRQKLIVLVVMILVIAICYMMAGKVFASAKKYRRGAAQDAICVASHNIRSLMALPGSRLPQDERLVEASGIKTLKTLRGEPNTTVAEVHRLSDAEYAMVLRPDIAQDNPDYAQAVQNLKVDEAPSPCFDNS